VISIKTLEIKFGDFTALDITSKQFETGAIHGIVGLNGAGKTTFFNTMACNFKALSGEVLFEDKPLSHKKVAYLETQNFFYSNLNGNEYLEIFKQTNVDFKLDALQAFFQLPLDELIETYSTGMKKKLALLGILKQDKPIFLLDEPFNGLDLESNKLVELLIVALKEKGKTVFLSSHIIDPLLSTCDEIHHLKSGSFVKHYSKEHFSQIEDDLFQKYKEDVKAVITNAI
jgi:ABC-2 type transport system ATP-binding protein